MNTPFLPAAWHKALLPLLAPSPARRGRRTLRLEQLMTGTQGHGASGTSDSGENFDGSWHESSRALARGLVVREWGDVPRQGVMSPERQR